MATPSTITTDTDPPNATDDTLPRPPGTPPLSELAWRLIRSHTTGPGSPTQQLATVTGTPLTRRSFRTLHPQVWLDDEVINAYTSLLRHREQQLAAADNNRAWDCRVYSTFFYQLLLQPHHDDPNLANRYTYSAVRQWGRRTNIFQLRCLLIPLHVRGSHWICAEVDFTTQTIRILDSMGGTWDTVGAHLHRYLQDEHQTRYGRPLPHVWRIEMARGIPQQGNGYDCGVFCCMFIDRLLRQRGWDFTAAHSRYLRARITLALIQGSAPLE